MKSLISRHITHRQSAITSPSALLALRSLGAGGSTKSTTSTPSTKSTSPRSLALAPALAALLLTGCKATETIAAGITTKNVSGNGTVVDSRIGIDPDTKIPALKTVFISGDFATVKAGTNQVSYREESTSSIWNASSVTKKRFLAITLNDAGDVPNAIKAVAEVFKTAEAEATPADEENASAAE